MSTTVKCPICLNPSDDCIKHTLGGFDGHGYECRYCGKYKITGTAETDIFRYEYTRISKIERATLAWLVTNHSGPIIAITTDFVEKVRSGSYLLPSPAQQATNLIRYIGDFVRRVGDELEDFPENIHAIVGSSGTNMTRNILRELKNKDIISTVETRSLDESLGFINTSLTLSGWERYESEVLGKTSSKYGFIALKFNDIYLDKFINDHMKPAAFEIGYKLVDMRDVSQVGLIDNIMRMQIRDSAFVIADLTHDNPGAYWEAGYAEGLGKPVLYVCEKKKYDALKTHFDTNHSTTICWDADSPKTFVDEFQATLQRSLIL